MILEKLQPAPCRLGAFRQAEMWRCRRNQRAMEDEDPGDPKKCDEKWAGWFKTMETCKDTLGRFVDFVDVFSLG